MKLHSEEVHEKLLPIKENEKNSSESEQTSILQSDNLEFNPSNNKINAIKDSTDFLNEIDQIHEIKTVPFKCQICEKEFSSNFNLKGHFKSFHEKQKTFKCQICNREFGRNGSLNINIKIVHEKQNAD